MSRKFKTLIQKIEILFMIRNERINYRLIRLQIKFNFVNFMTMKSIDDDVNTHIYSLESISIKNEI